MTPDAVFDWLFVAFIGSLFALFIAFMLLTLVQIAIEVIEEWRRAHGR